MASTYSPSLKITLIGDGDQAGIWGQTTNTNLGTLIEQAITGVTSIVMSNANYTLNNFDGVSNEARNAVLVVTGANSAIRNVIPPVAQKLYTIVNNTSGGFAIRVIGATGTGVLVANGTTQNVYCDGTNFVVASGAFTNGEVLNVASGGTGLTTLTANNVILGNGASNPTFVAPSTAGNVLTSNGTTWVSSSNAPEFPSGTRMTFNQTTAPTFWTKDTSTDDAGFRLVSGSVGSGGSVDFTTAFSSATAVNVTSVTATIGATTLSTGQIPSHSHVMTGTQFGGCFTTNWVVQNTATPTLTGNATNTAGGGGSHDHSFIFTSGAGTVDLAVKYVDLIIAQKN
jgi:hypothetical protein